MHNYSIDTRERVYVVFKLALISIVLVTILKNFLTNITFIHLSISISSLSLTIFGFIYYLFDNYLWDFKIIRLALGVKVPNLSGEWKGEFVSSYQARDDGTGGVKGEVQIKIKQTWSKISICSNNPGSSKSYSHIAGIFLKDPKGIVLKYEYENEPIESFVNSMNRHSGFESIVYDEDDKNSMYGSYYNDKYRKTYGTKKYTRVNQI